MKRELTDVHSSVPIECYSYWSEGEKSLASTMAEQPATHGAAPTHATAWMHPADVMPKEEASHKRTNGDAPTCMQDRQTNSNLQQGSPNFLEPETGYMGDNFSMARGLGEQVREVVQVQG